MGEDRGRLGLTILGGYLGAGKTTWLRHQLHAGMFGPFPHVVVNEAAAASVDDALLPAGGQMTVIAGGCACCTARRDLVLALRALCDARSAGQGPDQVILETSGLADPAAIAAILGNDPILMRHMRLHQTIVVVDALHGLAQLGDDPLWRAQVTAAERLVVTKADVGDPSEVKRLLAALRHLNPSAIVEGAARGSMVALPSDLPEFDPSSVSAPAGSELLSTIELKLMKPDWAGFSLWLSALLHARGDDIVRVKGVIATPAGRLLLQGVRRIVQQPEILPGPHARDGDDTIVIFGRGISSDVLARSLARFLGRGVAADAAARPLERTEQG